jgi:hypothetical protein
VAVEDEAAAWKERSRRGGGDMEGLRRKPVVVV